MLIKGKKKAQGFCCGRRDGKNIYLKSIIHFRAVYFLAGLYCYYFLEQQSNTGEEKYLLFQLVLHIVVTWIKWFYVALYTKLYAS